MGKMALFSRVGSADAEFHRQNFMHVDLLSNKSSLPVNRYMEPLGE